MACNKDKDDLGSPAGSELKKLPGNIYYKWADEGIFVLNLPSASQSLLLQDKIRRNDWDISFDNKYVLECSDVQGDYQASQFTLSNISDGTIVKQFKYYASEGDIATGTLSPNGQLIAIDPTFHDGIVITDLDGNEVKHILTVNNEKITEDPVWMSDNTLLITHKQFLLKSNADFTQVSLIKEFDFQDWGSPAVSRDGKKIAFSASKHIWLMNADGTDLKQVTKSSTAETSPQFSPDGKYLLIGTDFHITGPFGSIFYLKVIPADGRQYQVDDDAESEGVIPLILNGKSQPEAGDGRMVWR
ncbi:hypothetical protein [Albibacterium sp.]|uniref:TolB family protein n=1 Tax=Albibacterium sp. TaxID=2952885 RepID=UPI002C136671|nr:hypothetical protein [Albibacterium sp.]HUH19507.1 hypothetical protein [Albibacterium sp.]